MSPKKGIYPWIKSIFQKNQSEPEKQSEDRPDNPPMKVVYGGPDYFRRRGEGKPGKTEIKEVYGGPAINPDQEQEDPDANYIEEVYAGPEYFAKKDQERPEDDLITAVYAGPAYFSGIPMEGTTPDDAAAPPDPDEDTIPIPPIREEEAKKWTPEINTIYDFKLDKIAPDNPPFMQLYAAPMNPDIALKNGYLDPEKEDWDGPVCPVCGAKVTDDRKFCPECGSRLKKDDKNVTI